MSCGPPGGDTTDLRHLHLGRVEEIVKEIFKVEETSWEEETATLKEEETSWEEETSTLRVEETTLGVSFRVWLILLEIPGRW